MVVKVHLCALKTQEMFAEVISRISLKYSTKDGLNVVKMMLLTKKQLDEQD